VNKREKAWLQKFKETIEYKKKYGTANLDTLWNTYKDSNSELTNQEAGQITDSVDKEEVKNFDKLRAWQKRQQAAWYKGDLSRKQVNLLKSIGFKLGTLRSFYRKGVERTKIYKKITGHPKCPEDYTDNNEWPPFPLGKWQQRVLELIEHLKFPKYNEEGLYEVPPRYDWERGIQPQTSWPFGTGRVSEDLLVAWDKHKLLKEGLWFGSGEEIEKFNHYHEERKNRRERAVKKNKTVNEMVEELSKYSDAQLERFRNMTLTFGQEQDGALEAFLIGELVRYQRDGLSKVEILADCCTDSCAENNGKVFTVSEALEKMPLPCGAGAKCTSCYTPVVE
jgi:hypothetical protein